MDVSFVFCFVFLKIVDFFFSFDKSGNTVGIMSSNRFFVDRSSSFYVSETTIQINRLISSQHILDVFHFIL